MHTHPTIRYRIQNRQRGLSNRVHLLRHLYQRPPVISISPMGAPHHEIAMPLRHLIFVQPVAVIGVELLRIGQPRLRRGMESPSSPQIVEGSLR